MANKVFANGLEISCKVSKGKSVAAFPDPCWSPPIEMAADSHSNAFPRQCSSNCIKEQLKVYYEKLDCEDIKPKAIKSLETLNKAPDKKKGNSQ